MTLLTELQSKVAAVEADERARSAEIQAQAEFYNLELRPVMVRINEYFKEIIESLNVIKPEISARYPLDPESSIGVELRQSNYYYNYDNIEAPRQIDIICECHLGKPTIFHVPTKLKVEDYSRALNDYDFSYDQKNHLDNFYEIRGATFTLEGPLKAQIRITASAADRCVFIHLRNIEHEPMKRYRFAPSDLKDEVLERLARMLLREESQLAEVSVSTDFRLTLQQQLEEEKLQVEKHIAESMAHIESERLAEQEAKLLNRGKRIISLNANRVIKAASKLGTGK